MSNKYGARRTYSALCGRTFDSKLEARRGEELELLQKAGEISGLEFQVKFQLTSNGIRPKVTYTADFKYKELTGLRRIIHEDSKGVLTEATRVRIAWVKDKYGIEILLT